MALSERHDTYLCETKPLDVQLSRNSSRCDTVVLHVKDYAKKEEDELSIPTNWLRDLIPVDGYRAIGGEKSSFGVLKLQTAVGD